jgi:hypothetical protein
MASDQNQLNYWFGAAAPEMRVTMSGGGPGRIPADQMLENMRPSDIRPPVAANDPASIGLAPTGYRGASTQQAIVRAIDKDTHTGDWQYWQNLADQEGHISPMLKAPSGMQALQNYSKDGRTTMMLLPDGRRVVFKNGQRIAHESAPDFAR